MRLSDSDEDEEEPVERVGSRALALAITLVDFQKVTPSTKLKMHPAPTSINLTNNFDEQSPPSLRDNCTPKEICEMIVYANREKLFRPPNDNYFDPGEMYIYDEKIKLVRF